jgi:hypothetical protein
MTIIQCEFCGPERVAPHDVNCPMRNSQPKHFDYEDYGYFQPGDLIGHAGVNFGFAPEPLITRNPDHETMRGRFGAVCKCGYDPHETHPEAGRGQLFAYVGYHIRESSRG